MPPVPSEAPARAGESEDLVVEVRHQGERLPVSRAACTSGVGRKQAGDHAQDDEERGLEQVGDHRGEPVVVAELDLVDADGVVLVDDRDSVPVEEGAQRVAHVEVARPAVEVFVRE